jgi:hypothetical protein
MLSLLLLILIWAPCLSFKLIFALETTHRTLSLWTIIFIWAPGLIFSLFFTFILRRFYGLSIADWVSSDQRYWHLHHQGEPAYISSDVLEIEKPRWILWLIVLITVVTICFSYSRFPQQAKEGLLYSIIANMLFIRCLSTFSGITHHEESMLWFWFPWDTRSPLKGFILASFVKLRLWDGLWLGAYSDSPDISPLYKSTSVSQAVAQSGQGWRSRSRSRSRSAATSTAPSDTAPKQSIAESVDSAVDSSQNTTPLNLTGGDAPSWLDQPNLLLDMFHLLDLLSLRVFYYGIIYQHKPVSWRDAMIRLAFYHVLDNTAVVLQLRFFYPYGEGAPYTTYVNNSEIATSVLILQVCIWKLFRTRERYVAWLQKEKAMTEDC